MQETMVWSENFEVPAQVKVKEAQSLGKYSKINFRQVGYFMLGYIPLAYLTIALLAVGTCPA